MALYIPRKNVEVSKQTIYFMGNILYNGFKRGEQVRQSKNFEELEESIKLTVRTRSPEKYLLIDRETGNIFVGNSMGHWDRLDPVTRDS
jgi:hypothetical protein